MDSNCNFDRAWEMCSSGSLQALLKGMDKDSIVNIVNLRSSKDITLLHLAVLEDKEAAVKELLDCGACVEAEDGDKQKPLHFARSVNVAKLLLDSNAEIDAKDSKGKTILYYAYIERNESLARLLLKRKANFADAKKLLLLPSNCSEVQFLHLMRLADYDADMPDMPHYEDDDDDDDADLIYKNDNPIYEYYF